MLLCKSKPQKKEAGLGLFLQMFAVRSVFVGWPLKLVQVIWNGKSFSVRIGKLFLANYQGKKKLCETCLLTVDSCTAVPDSFSSGKKYRHLGQSMLKIEKSSLRLPHFPFFLLLLLLSLLETVTEFWTVLEGL